ncbi:glycosyltransferase family 2 protein [Mycolicibacterium grossiae]|uniref:glycosyltransferase family 2 protein n=1 Tax=Mycolicibacterium grossiae TaxID=1552759 RepID=UPI0009F500E6|nr:glycosyltransferase family 2 protein [Mycolicibacterium grossiae]QEM45235.1 glycosyltransferase family 2 protein [Mycolicibacterium grossiae]
MTHVAGEATVTAEESVTGVQHSTATPHVAAVVLNWNGAEDTITCVESLLRSTHPCLSVIICDNASRDDSVERIRGWGATISTSHPTFAFKEWTPHDVGRSGNDLAGTVNLVRSERNGGYAAGNNLAMRFALEDPSVVAVWILNNDVVVEESALTEAWAVLRDDDRIGIVGATLRYYERSDVIQCQAGGSFVPRKGLAETIGAGRPATDPLSADHVLSRLDFINGAAALVSRRMIETVGMMSEDYFLYWEELDWAYRARSIFQLSYAPAAVIRHKVGASIGTNDHGEGSVLSEYYYNRNRLRFCWRHSRTSLPYVWMQLSWDLLRAIASRRRRRATVLSRAMLGLPGPQPS